MAMRIQSNHFGSAECANDAFTTFSPVDLHLDKWPTFDNPSFVNPSFTIPPFLFTQGSVERFGQVTPPEELSPAVPPSVPPPFREARHGSIPVEELMGDALFPDHQLQALQDFQPPQQQQQQQQQQQKGQQISSDGVSLPQKQQLDQGRTATRRRTFRNPSSVSQASATNHMSTDPSTTQAPPDNPQPLKRKRGRPKSQPQMVEAFTADGFPFKVSSARQSHLEKNRVAAHKCRQRKKEYIGSLKHRAREHAAKNRALKQNIAMLREELLELKNEVLRHAGCDFGAVGEYLSRCAGDFLGMQAPGFDMATHSRMQQTNLCTTTTTTTTTTTHNTNTNTNAHDSDMHSQSQSPVMSTMEPNKLHRESSLESLPSQPNDDEDSFDDFDGFDLLQDMENDSEIQTV